MYVCICKDIKSKQIKKAIASGHDSLEALQDELDIATCCGCCEPMVQDFIDEHNKTLSSLVIAV